MRTHSMVQMVSNPSIYVCASPSKAPRSMSARHRHVLRSFLLFNRVLTFADQVYPLTLATLNCLLVLALLVRSPRTSLLIGPQLFTSRTLLLVNTRWFNRLVACLRELTPIFARLHFSCFVVTCFLLSARSTDGVKAGRIALPSGLFLATKGRSPIIFFVRLLAFNHILYICLLPLAPQMITDNSLQILPPLSKRWQHFSLCLPCRF